MPEPQTQPVSTPADAAQDCVLSLYDRDYWTAKIADELLNGDEPLNERIESILDGLGADGWLALCQFPPE